MKQKLSGLQRALSRIEVLRPGMDAIDHLADVLRLQRKTILSWLREDGTPVNEPIELREGRVVDAVNKAGGVPAMARTLGVSPQAVREWVRSGCVPPARAKEIEMLYGIPRTELVSAKVRHAMGLAMGAEL